MEGVGSWSSVGEPEGGAARHASSEAGAAPPEDWGRAHDALFCPDAGEAYIAIDAQIRAVEILSRGVQSSPERAYVERCVAQLDRVRDALHDLHFGAVDARTSGHDHKGRPVGAYLVAVHLWCRYLLEGLRRHASPLRASASALADDSCARIVVHVEPLFRELLLSGTAEPDPERAIQPTLQRAERVHSEIVRLNRALLTCAPPA